jgi:transcriptional regulator with XRE-family HTH domain
MVVWMDKQKLQGFGFRKILRAIRLDLKMNQTDMAQILGCDTSVLSLYECGHRRVHPAILERLVYLGADLHSDESGRLYRYGMSKDVARIRADEFLQQELQK